MPFIKVKTNCSITEEQEIQLKAGMGKAIALVPGKSENYLLLTFEDDGRLWLRGKNNMPAAYIEAAIFGNGSHAGYDAFSIAVTALFSEVLGISPENIYIRFEDIPAWSVSGTFIDRHAWR